MGEPPNPKPLTLNPKTRGRPELFREGTTALSASGLRSQGDYIGFRGFLCRVSGFWGLRFEAWGSQGLRKGVRTYSEPKG